MRRLVAWIVVFLVVMLTFSWASPLVRAVWTLPWGVERIHAQCVWDNNNDKTIDAGANAGDNVTIGVIDTGVYYYDDASGRHYHPDLEGNIVGGCTFTYDGQQVIRDDGQYCDSRNHGTHVTGSIAATGRAGGLVGVAPRAKIYVLKVASAYNPDPTYVAMEVAAAINWAVLDVEHNCSILSISLGWSDPSQEVYQACFNAHVRGILIVAAAGDAPDGPGPIDYPAAFSSSIDTVVAVGDTYPNDRRYERCNVGPELDVMAPGVNINSTVWSYDDGCGGYDIKKGSSMAVPHVTGMAALIFKSRMDPYWDSNKTGTWDGREVAYEIKWNCLFIGNGPPEYGNGLVNPWEAIQRPDYGDVNNDLKVDVKDVAIVARAYGTHPGDPRWQARADIDIDNFVSTYDVATASRHFGEVDP